MNDFSSVDQDILFQIEDCQAEEVLLAFHPNRIYQNFFIAITTCISMTACLATFTIYVHTRKIKLRLEWQSFRNWILWNFICSFIFRDVIILSLLTVCMINRYIEVTGIGLFEILYTYSLMCTNLWMVMIAMYLNIHDPSCHHMYPLKAAMRFVGWIMPVILLCVWIKSELSMTPNLTLSDIPLLICVSWPRNILGMLNVISFAMLFFLVCSDASETNRRNKHVTLLGNHGDRKHKKKVKLVPAVHDGTNRSYAQLQVYKIMAIASALIGFAFLLPTLIKIALDPKTDTIFVFYDLLGSLQGFFVAIFFIFINQELMMHAKRTLFRKFCSCFISKAVHIMTTAEEV